MALYQLIFIYLNSPDMKERKIDGDLSLTE